ncbi:hypothetical protein CBR_g52747 [Chara braunii]|uniref:RecA family profile 1 domain-containing protein n=1 Tax=Chara braunii TaxID=69332 RepID=A0A388MAS7_CHABU|nr:hypothetical protein CBR_g52747 [Chara braunii]|eukprot:GBG91668.1 hypothetical protein CBR_g52747 [Chara braunii]
MIPTRTATVRRKEGEVRARKDERPPSSSMLCRDRNLGNGSDPDSSFDESFSISSLHKQHSSAIGIATLDSPDHQVAIPMADTAITLGGRDPRVRVSRRCQQLAKKKNNFAVVRVKGTVCQSLSSMECLRWRCESRAKLNEKKAGGGIEAFGAVSGSLQGFVTTSRSYTSLTSKSLVRAGAMQQGGSGKGGGGINLRGLKKKKESRPYMCTNCGEIHAQWFGVCNYCEEMNSIKLVPAEFLDDAPGSAGAKGGARGGGAAARAVAKVAAAADLQSIAGSFGAENPDALGLNGDTAKRSEQGRSAQNGGGGGWVNNMIAGPRRLIDIGKDGLRGTRMITLGGPNGSELARVLGGGLEPGSLVLVGGDPGVGKSTLLLQVAGLLSEGERLVSTDNVSAGTSMSPVLYVSGEESAQQVCSRSERMGIKSENLFLYSTNSMEMILEAMVNLKPRAVVIDSIQTVYLQEATGSAGSVSQVRECTAALMHAAKQSDTPIFLIGHVTKSGDIAGPRILEHMVDVVLYMEGERLQSHRLLRCVKNRYGSTNEVGVFEMMEEGLAAVSNPSQLFLGDRDGYLDAGGSERKNCNAAAGAVGVVMEGTRPLLVEIQALCSGTSQPPGRRACTGYDPMRLHMLLAVLNKQVGMRLWNQDVFVNVVGGLQLREPSADLAVAIAVAASFLDKPIRRNVAFVGEIGLGGELRSVGQVDRRLAEAAKLGFQECIFPKVDAKRLGRSLNSQTLSHLQSSSDVRHFPCGHVKEAICRALDIDASLLTVRTRKQT